MATEPNTFLFGEDCIATASSGWGDFEHTFGGPHDRRGTSREECNGILIHLLHRFDLTDPVVPISIPGIRWLPLYYCFDFRVCDLGYRLISDEELVMYFPEDDPHVTDHEEWPEEGYPTEFPRSSIRVAARAYDPTDLEDAYRWAGVFGIGKLSKRDQAAAKKRVAKLMKGLGFYPPETEEDYAEAFSDPFAQGKPDSPCLNPECPNHDRKGRLTPLALMSAEPVKGIRTCGPWGSTTQIIFLICPECHTVRVTNQCD